MQFLTFYNSRFVTVTIVNIYDASTHEVKINGKDLANALRIASENYCNQDNASVEILDEDCNIVTVKVDAFNTMTWNQSGRYAQYYLTSMETKTILTMYK